MPIISHEKFHSLYLYLPESLANCYITSHDIPIFLLAMLVFWWVWHYQLAPSGRTKLSPLPTPAKIARGVKARWESPKEKEHHGYIMIMYIYIYML